MIRLLSGLRAQLTLLIVAALVVAQAISLWLFVDERRSAIQATLVSETAGRAANVALLIEEAPPDLREAILRAADSPLVRFSLAPEPAIDHFDHRDGAQVTTQIRRVTGMGGSRDIRADLHDVTTEFVPMPHMSSNMQAVHNSVMGSVMPTTELQVSIQLLDGGWLNVDTRLQRLPLQWGMASVVSFALSAALILIVASWFLLVRITGPLSRIATSAEHLGRGEDVVPLDAVGPIEVRNLIGAFNRMQGRIGRFISDRTRLLGAMGHDLRSPLTALRVQAEMVDDGETRDAMVRSIAEMQQMVDDTLSFARGLASTEPHATVDLARFLLDLRSDMDAAFEVRTVSGVTLRLRPNAIRRALRNIIENAIRYAGEAEVSVRETGDMVEIDVADRGPGISEADLDRVFEPFVRLERSRSRETGGTGLGLSIARSIARAHGGDLVLKTRPGGGLVAVLSLPLDCQS